MTSAEIQAVIDAQQDSNGIPGVQNMGGVVTIPEGLHTLTAPIKVKTCSTIEGAERGTVLTGAIDNRYLLEYYGRNGETTAYDVAVKGINLYNTGTGGGCIGPHADTVGGYNRIHIENVQCRSKGLPINLRRADNQEAFGATLRDVVIFGSETTYLDIYARIFRIDGLVCVNNRETEDPTSMLTTGQVIKLQGTDGAVDGMWLEGDFYRPLLRLIAPCDFRGCHFEAKKNRTNNGPDYQIEIEGYDLDLFPSALPMGVTFDKLDFVYPYQPLRVTNSAALDVGVISTVQADIATAFNISSQATLTSRGRRLLVGAAVATVVAGQCTVFGHVRDQHGDAVNNRRVTFRMSSPPSGTGSVFDHAPVQVTSDATGLFSADLVRGGTYSMRVGSVVTSFIVPDDDLLEVGNLAA